MAKKKAAPKKAKKKKATKAPTTKKAAQKAKAAAGAKKKPVAKAKVAAQTKATAAQAKATAAEAKAPATKTKEAARKAPPRRTPPSAEASVLRGSQDVETVRLKPKSRVARAGTGAGDLQGISIVEDVDSESADELLEEGQAFEAGIVSGVEKAGDAEESEVITHEVLEDDVPKEYDDDDRP
jgi:hypothetical protein